MNNPYAVIDPPTPIFTKVGKIVRAEAAVATRLRDVQKDALSSLEKWFTNSETTRKTAVVVIPTGAGKTGIMCCLPYYLASSEVPIEGLDFSKPVLFIAPDLNILKQLTNELSIPSTEESPKPFLVRREIILDDAVTLEKTMPPVIVPTPSELCRYLRAQGGIIVTNAHKWHTRSNAVWENLKEDFFSLVIVDEAHHLPADQWKRVVDKFRNHARVVFFTATPYRADGKSICDDIGEKGFAYRLSRDNAIESKIIRPATFWEGKENPQEDTHTTLLHYTVEHLQKKARLFPLPSPNNHVAMIIMGNVQEANEMVEKAKRICSELPAVAIHRNLTPVERRNAMDAIQKGKIRIIIIVKMLLEGFDHPPVSIAAICTNIGSPVKFAQFIGRAQRVIPGEKDVVADVISLEVFKQSRNYDNYNKEWLIPKTEAEVEDEEAK